MSKIRETNNDLAANSQGLFQYYVRFIYLLETLIENDIIKRLIWITRKTIINILIKHTQPSGNALIDGLLVNLDTLSLHVPFLNK